MHPWRPDGGTRTPLSTQALVRAQFAEFLAYNRPAQIVSWDGATAYVFVRRDENPADAWNVPVDTLITIRLEEGVGKVGSLIGCLGPMRLSLDTASITCVSRAHSPSTG